MPSLPALLKNVLTKTSNDAAIFANLDVGRQIGSLSYVDSAVVKYPYASCGGVSANVAGGFAAIVANKKNAGTINSPPFPDGLPAMAPIFSAFESATSSEDIDDYTATFTQEGDSADVLWLPNPGNDFLICYDQSFSPSFGQMFRPVPRKYNTADHYVRQRFEGTLSLSDIFVSNYDGIQRLRGIPCTIIVKISSGGTGVWSEIHYYNNVLITGPAMNTQSDGNSSIEISAQGSFSSCAIFAPNE